MGDEVKVSDEDVRALGILQAALGAGPLMFWVAIVVMSQLPELQGRTADAGQVQLVMLLSAVHGVVCLSTWPLAVVLFQRTLSAGGGDAPGSTSGPHSGSMSRLRAATILRLALFEAPALLGAVTCLLALQLGAARELPLVWLNAASTFVLLFMVVVTFPTRERVERTLRDLHGDA